MDAPYSRLASDVTSLGSLKKASRDNSPEALKAASQQFEALFMNMLMKSMRASVPDGGLVSSDQVKTFEGMLDQQLSQHLSGKGALGLAAMLEKQLSRQFSIGDKPAGPASTGPTPPETE